MMGWEAGFVLLSLLGMVGLLIRDIIRPELVVSSVMLLFLLTGIISPQEALLVFSNEGLITIALLFILAGTIDKSSVMETLFKRVVSGSRPNKIFLLKLLAPFQSVRPSLIICQSSSCSLRSSGTGAGSIMYHPLNSSYLFPMPLS
ncbi:hypothetical protein [Rossellomorea vietnamensis]|uniref:hypothetical protein n=1 Tax=Rossellomorea vietnamensis TaxID=218284 RepID=UPI0016536EB1|nr:hypothetical protein [Rossellomorea vietnamensis]